MRWLFKPRLNLFDGFMLVIAVGLLTNGFVILGVIALTVGPLTSIIIESSVFKVDIDGSENP